MDVTMSGEDWSLVKGCNNYSYNNLFNLEPLVNIRVPDDFDDFVTISSSQDGSEHTRDNSRLYSGEDGAEAPMDLQTEMTTKRKRLQIEAEAGSDSVLRDDADSNDDEDNSGSQIPEDHYRGSLGNHLPKRTRLKEAISTRFVANASHCSNSTENFDAFGSHSRPVLDLGEGFRLFIPPTYEQLTESTSLPSMSSIHIDESVLKGPLTSTNLQTIITSDRHKSVPSCSSRAQRNATSQKKFSLQVLPPDKKLWLSVDETQVNGERQLGGSDVKVIEKGDGYEVIQRRVQRKPPSTKNPLEIAQEDVEKVAKYWVSIIRKDLPKHFKAFQSYHKKQYNECKKFADACQKEVKSRNAKLVRLMRNAPNRNRKLARDMAAFWRKLDKEQAEVRKKEEKDAVEALKRDEEFREARRHQQRLNFLLTQTELYSHFMQNKPAGEKLPAEGEEPPLPNMENVLDDPVLKAEAFEAAKKAALEQKERTSLFDDECLKIRQEYALDGDKIDLLNPSTMPISSSVKQPSLFQGNLKEYQLKGLQWLVSCYEQGLNGILADEMGLGKTIQAMAFLAHLAEEKNIWGPFLVIAPATVTTNWAEELKRFCPHFTVLPYWGHQSQRTLLRKVIHEKHLYRRDSGFHVAITNYQLLVSDEKYLKRVKWQYMVLDEAQAIKSSQSLRWKTLLSFSCRNRLLLTGTPIQNNMGELWALLHFIMPTLFDSHDQFNEWFSKGIEGHAEHGGTLNEHQLNRLHAVLKPFMLRRVKKDVITELTNKREVVVPCTLSSRQQAIYQAVKNKISIADLFAAGRMNEKKALSLMNIVIQLRKVCNHPELFERNEGRTYYYFSAFTNPLLAPPFRELEHVYYSGAYNPISVKIPKLLYREGMPCVRSGSPLGFLDKWVNNLLNIFAAENVHTSRTFDFTRLMNLSPAEISFISRASLLERWQYALCDFFYDYENDPKVRAVTKMLLLPSTSCSSSLKRTLAVGPSSDPFQSLVVSSERRFLSNIQLLRSSRAFIPPVLAPQINVLCSDSSFAYQRAEELNNPWIKRILVGFGRTSEYNGPSVPRAPHHLIEEVDRNQKALLAPTYQVFGSAPPLQSFDFARTLMDSGKLQALDALLRRLRTEDHRVLVFAQMTKMLNILEDYMVYRKYKYLRLDGSLAVNDRQDMVKDFQLKSDIFVFLLSTRAGGLGINLTAADTVIFYESDWNPTMDLQAMDRAHRLGQTKEVTVYRLICKGTVEEKILKRANQKNTVQQLVMTGELFEPDEVVSLLLDDAELEQRLKQHPTNEQGKRKKDGKKVQIDANGEVTLQDDTETNPSATAAVGNKRKSQKRQQTGDDNTRPPKAPKRRDNASATEQVPKEQPKSRSKSRGKKACNSTATEAERTVT